jgi:hypothetical protein
MPNGFSMCSLHKVHEMIVLLVYVHDMTSVCSFVIIISSWTLMEFCIFHQWSTDLQMETNIIAKCKIVKNILQKQAYSIVSTPFHSCWKPQPELVFSLSSIESTQFSSSLLSLQQLSFYIQGLTALVHSIPKLERYLHISHQHCSLSTLHLHSYTDQKVGNCCSCLRNINFLKNLLQG